MRHAKRIGANNTYAVRVHVTKSLAEALETSEGARGDLFIDATVFLDAGAEANHLAQSINDD